MSLKSLMQNEAVACHIQIRGRVQGVGFRPYLYQLALSLNVQGWVLNTGSGLELELSAAQAGPLDLFVERVREAPPPGASLDSIDVRRIQPKSYARFEIRESLSGVISTDIPYDVAVCAPCQAELLDPSNRRYLYPFISCALCGPRFTILDQLPFDRNNTSMQDFPLCEACAAEYANPKDRRFHAQTISCPSCGPQLNLWDQSGQTLAAGSSAVQKAASMLLQGYTVALKGLGGYQLAVDARNDLAVERLRKRKGRSEKPFALMFPNMTSLREECFVSPEEEQTLSSAAAPIVLLKQRPHSTLSALVSGPIAQHGAMLPNSPLHLLLLEEVKGPLVMTSGNRAGEPIIPDDQEALEELQGLADVFLQHNRRIIHRADDSIVKWIDDQGVALRRGRGLAPYSLKSKPSPFPAVAFGAQQKNTFALQRDDRILVSQHIGDLSSPESCNFLEDEIASYQKLMGMSSDLGLHDKHPDYHSTRLAQDLMPRARGIQHHKAHVFGCIAEHQWQNSALALAWDGAGLGDDGLIWGGEAFLYDPAASQLEHCGSLLPFPLIGGDRAAKEPRRCAVAIGHILFGKALPDGFVTFGIESCLNDFSKEEQALLLSMLQHPENFMQTTSVARLFEAVASLLNFRQVTSYEGQAAIMVEAAADSQLAYYPYAVRLLHEAKFSRVDWRPGILELLQDIKAKVPTKIIAARFHHMLVAAAELLLLKTHQHTLLLSGGVFQNAYLVKIFKNRGLKQNYRVLSQSQIPPNDGGLAVGQLCCYTHEMSFPCA